MNKTAILAGLAVAGLVTGLSGLGFGVAQAVTAIPPGTIHGCISGPSRALQRVYTNPSSGTTCPSGTFQVIWNVKGPQGPAGPAGPAGPSTAGSAGLDVVMVAAQDLTGGQVMAVCPADHPYVVGGGGSAASELVSSAPSASSPPPPKPNAWVVESSYGVTGQGNPGVEAEALCAK